MDIDSFIDFYIIQEVMGQPEINWKSVYMYKKAEKDEAREPARMKMGPVWDFDWAAMGPGLGDESNMYRDNVKGLRSDGNWFDLMLKNSAAFKADVEARFNEAKPLLLAAIETVRADKARIEPYAERNHLRWHWFRPFTSVTSYYDEVLDWCTKRIAWLDTVI